MIESIRNLFQRHLLDVEQAEVAADETSYQLATAALLVEMTRADLEVSEGERAAVEQALARAFGLGAGQLAELVAMAEAEREAATCLHGFVRAINDTLTYEKKVHIIELLWQVAFADDSIDRYEEHLARKVADLLHVSHGDFIRVKLEAEAARQ